MPRVFSKRLFNHRGITLIELIAVILIIGVIAAVGVPVVFNQINKAEEAALVANIALVNDAIDRYRLLEEKYPLIMYINKEAPPLLELYPFLADMNNDEILVAGLIGTLINFSGSNDYGVYIKGNLDYLDASKVVLLGEDGEVVEEHSKTVTAVKKK